MILSNLNEHCYIFEPNVLLVQCEDLTEPTKEVTLFYGSTGITLKRNCINSLCYFDMSILFESSFANSIFKLDYTGIVDDPFLKVGLFTIYADDETTQINISKSLRWGAYQFDEVKITQYRFPYWVGMPFLINCSENHDNYVIDGVTGTGVKTVPIVKTTQFTAIYKQSATAVATYTFYPVTCPSDGHYFQWVDAHGEIHHYMFYKSKVTQNQIEIKTGEVVPYYPISINDTNFGRSKVLSKSKDRSFGCYQSVDEDIYPIVESILSSPIVKYYTNSKWIEVKIKDNSVKPNRAGIVDIEFTVELPTDFNQRR